MELGIRELLVILGVGLVGYVVFDSWRNRRRNEYRFKLEKNLPPEAPAATTDRAGFDPYGVGKPRVRTLEEEAADRAAAEAHREPTFGDDAGEDVPVLTQSAAAPSAWTDAPDDADFPFVSRDAGSADVYADNSYANNNYAENSRSSEPSPAGRTLADSGRREPAPEQFDEMGVSAPRTVTPSRNADAERPRHAGADLPSQGEIGDLFGDAPSRPARRNATRETRSDARKDDLRKDDNRRGAQRPASTDVDVIALTVLAKPGRNFAGSALALCFMEHDLRFGDMNIFHRHADAAGQGEVLFSVANAVKPGTFDPDQMDKFSTPGVSLFMTMPGPQDVREAYAVLVQTAERLAAALDGEVHDGARKPFNAETRRKHQEQLSNFERRLFADA